jgi:DNA-binding SARP family transcriptional activator
LSLRVFLAGRVAVEVDGRAVDEDRFAGRQGRLVFACLVMAHGRAVPHEELAEAIWGESPPPTWRKALTVIVSKVRALLTACGIDATSVLTSAFGCYRLDLPPGSRVDVLEAIESEEEAEKALAAGELEAANAAARRAVDVTRRQFLPGDEGAWVDAKRRELSDVLCRALTCLADASLLSGRPSEAAKWAQEVTVLEPFRETGYRRLMEAHAAAGNGAEALRVYERCRVLLAEELGAYPSPETESIYRRLLDGSVPDSMPEREQPPREPDPVVKTSVPVARSKQSRFRLAVAALGAVAIAAAITAVGLRDTGDEGPTLARVQGNAVGVVDLESRAIVAEAPEIASPQRVAAGEGSVWVTSSRGGGSVVRLDPESHAVTDTIDVGNGPVGIAVGEGAVWVANSLDGTVSRIDPATGREVGDPIEVGNTPTGVAFGAGAVWVTNTGDRSLSKIDPVTGVVVSTTEVGTAARWVAVGGGAVWVTDPVGNTLVRIDARSGKPTDPMAAAR